MSSAPSCSFVDDVVGWELGSVAYIFAFPFPLDAIEILKKKKIKLIIKKKSRIRIKCNKKINGFY